MKILVVGDCHGRKPEIKEAVEEADVILATGDICGDSDEVRDAMFQSIDADREWYEILGREKARKTVEKSLQEGEEVISYLNSFEKPVFLVPGNWDWIGQDDWRYLNENRFQKMIEKYRNVHNINEESFSFSGVSFIGYGPCSGPEVPQYEDDKPGEDELEEMKEEYQEKKEQISELFTEADDPVVFLSHNVPHQTSLDEIKNEDSPAHGRHYGSLVVRDMIEDFEPVLSVAGHIHEGIGVEEVSNVTAINSGLHSHCMVEIKDGEIISVSDFR